MKEYLQKTTSAAPLAVFRIALGVLLFGSVMRFWAKGWIHELYIEPRYFFSFYGFEFVKPLGQFTYLLFAVCGICALLVAIGMYYRVAMTGLFLSFTYIELMDKSTYLNHYYFISMICLMMIFLPAHVRFSGDAVRDRSLAGNTVPRWCVDSIKFFVCIVYLYAGIAKLNADWLLNAQPLRTWLPARNDMPLIGSLFNYTWAAYAFSWLGCIYDLTIWFFLLNRRTRLAAYSAVVIFHTLTSLLFPIGMFPYIMMATALVFFSPEFHEKIIGTVGRWIRYPFNTARSGPWVPNRFSRRILPAAFGIFLGIQLLMPFRYVLYPGDLFWTEEGYRFSWRVMLMEKAGYAQFTVRDSSGKAAIVDNQQFLTTLQEKMMSTQPDIILQYAHILRDYYAASGFHSPEVYVDSYVALNGRLGKPLISPQTDLAKIKDSFKHKAWILPFENEIGGI